MEQTSVDDMVEVLREGLRDLSSSERKGHRTNLWNKNRPALGDALEDKKLTPEFVVEKAKALKKKPLSIIDYGYLQNALIQSEEHINAFLKVDSILYALVRDLSGKNPALKLCAASCCCNLALGNVKACIALAKHAGPYLIAGLSGLNFPLVGVYVWTIGNLVRGSHRAFEILHAQNCLNCLITLLTSCCDMLLPSVTYTAMHYVHAGHKDIEKNDLVNLARATIDKKFSFEEPYFVWLLALLSSTIDYDLYLSTRIPILIDYLCISSIHNFSNISVVTAILRILGNAVCEPTATVANAILYNDSNTQRDLESLLNKLLSHQYVHLRKETLWLIGNLNKHKTQSIQICLDKLLPNLLPLQQAVELNSV